PKRAIILFEVNGLQATGFQEYGDVDPNSDGNHMQAGMTICSTKTDNCCFLLLVDNIVRPLVRRIAKGYATNSRPLEVQMN
nr:hypothetical protein [Alphaproteobacteria bacterium]